MKLVETANRFLELIRSVAAMVAFTLGAGADSLQAQPIAVPNFSFESQSAVGFPFGTNPSLDSWQKIAEPAYYGSISGMFGISWFGTAGGFIGTATNSANPYANLLGTQAGYILAFPEVTLFQDFSTTPEFNATFEVGKSYHLTLGVYGSSLLSEGSTLELSLYYRDTLANRVKVGSTVITYSAAAFPNVANPSLIDFSVNLPTVQAGDTWAGENIGIQLESTVAMQLMSGRNWDFDNMRLTAVPEPATVALLGLGIGGLLWVRARFRS
jgi:hypothetical protein